MTLSIVIISWNSKACLETCLKSLESVMTRDDVEMIWVDNGSTDGAAEMVEKDYPVIKRIILPDNRGVAYARNRGMEIATGEYVLLLDDDTEASAEAVDAMLAHMREHQSTGLCGVRLCAPDGTVQQSFKEYPGVGVKLRNVLSSGERKVTVPDRVIYPCYVIGACQMFRRRLLDEVGMLDEKIFYGPEDADFCMRIKDAGYSIDYLPEPMVCHKWKRITRRRPFSRITRKHAAALIYFYKKHHRLF